MEKVEEREGRLKVLEAQATSQDHVRASLVLGARGTLTMAQATNMLYGEIDRLSAAWSTLDEQNSSKVFSLVNLEEKVQRLNTDVRILLALRSLRRGVAD